MESNRVPGSLGKKRSDVDRKRTGLPQLRLSPQASDPRLNGLLVNWYDGERSHYIGPNGDSLTSSVPGSPIVRSRRARSGRSACGHTGPRDAGVSRPATGWCSCCPTRRTSPERTRCHRGVPSGAAAVGILKGRPGRGWFDEAAWSIARATARGPDGRVPHSAGDRCPQPCVAVRAPAKSGWGPENPDAPVMAAASAVLRAASMNGGAAIPSGQAAPFSPPPGP